MFNHHDFNAWNKQAVEHKVSELLKKTTITDSEFHLWKEILLVRFKILIEALQKALSKHSTVKEHFASLVAILKETHDKLVTQGDSKTVDPLSGPISPEKLYRFMHQTQTLLQGYEELCQNKKEFENFVDHLPIPSSKKKVILSSKENIYQDLYSAFDIVTSNTAYPNSILEKVNIRDEEALQTVSNQVKISPRGLETVQSDEESVVEESKKPSFYSSLRNSVGSTFQRRRKDSKGSGKDTDKENNTPEENRRPKKK